MERGYDTYGYDINIRSMEYAKKKQSELRRLIHLIRWRVIEMLITIIADKPIATNPAGINEEVLLCFVMLYR